ncbi:MAG: hypothetical protein SGJ09_00400 [Phycisphaerae bacterium]|mgnify:CR=1 FL=1|nr:hypothetical protein [Phycisphaerae bacterium]MDZ4828640.1 hypothetical protein [Phycisphaerae bacterium]
MGRFIVLLYALASLLVFVIAMPVHAGLVDSFVLALEEPVSNGVPVRGAGNIEVAGATDTYELTIDKPTIVYFDEQSSSCALTWTCVGPANVVVFGANQMCGLDPSQQYLAPGVYTITVTGPQPGIYAFTVWALNPPEQFSIALEQGVSNGVPVAGAGNIEEPGAKDQYQLAIAAPTSVYFEEQSGGCALIWSCVSPSGALVFSDSAICVGDPGVFALSEAGPYTITVAGNGSATGTYAFTVWQLDEPEVFTIALDTTISSGVPAAGAGVIEEPGATDVYQLTIAAPTAIYAEELTGACNIAWLCTDPNGVVLFSDSAICVTDPGSLTLATPGTYTITVVGVGGSTGTYSFKLWTLSPPQVFEIALNDVVANGIPGTGAGNLETPGSIDVYALNVVFPTTVYFDELRGNCSIFWGAVDPNSTSLFANNVICVTDPGTFTLLSPGVHLITVKSPSGGIGTYAFRVIESMPPQLFDIALGDIVANGIPAAGAGNIEQPGSLDVYRFDAEAGDVVCFDEIAGACSLAWQLTDPLNAAVFSDSAMCVNTPGKRTLTTTGTYTISVYGPGGTSGVYSFGIFPGSAADLDGDCHVSAPDLAILLGAWGVCPSGCEADLDDDGVVSAPDIAILLGAWN